MVLLKVCGLTRRIDVEFIDKYADYAGFIIHSDTPTPRLVNLRDAIDMAGSLSRARPVAVIKGLSLGEAMNLAAKAGFPVLQFHGPINADLITSEYGNVNVAPVVEYTNDSQVIETVKTYLTLGNVEYVLVDAPKVGYMVFEHGLKIPLSIITKIAGLDKAGVAGGIGPGNIRLVVKYRPYLIDVNSGVESKPGVKDWGLVMQVARVVKGEGAA